MNRQIIFVYKPYPKTTKLRYWFIALSTHKCGECEL